jgi:lipoprotein
LMDDCEQANMGLRGGLLVGDRMAVIGRNVDGEFQATGVLNLTTLLGRWNSIDKDFEIEEGGAIQTYQPVEKNDWKVWKIFNGKLLLGRDSFQVNTLGPDSLVLENKDGIFVYKRKENKKR